MHRDACCVLIKVNPDFVRHLRRIFEGERRVRIFHGSAATVEGVVQHLGFEAADYVISGIPFSTMPEKLRFSILAASNRVLRKDGRLLIYQFTRTVLPDLTSVLPHRHSGDRRGDEYRHYYGRQQRIVGSSRELRHEQDIRHE